jgi:tetratricopeptide (TPR) repeat protein
MNAAKRIGVALTLLVLASHAFAATGLPPSTETDQQIERASKLFEEGHSLGARKIYESLLPALRSRAPSSQLGFVLNAMSKIVAADGNYSDSIQLAEQSAQVYRQIGDVGGESHALNNKAIAKLQNGSYPGARQDLEQALVLSRSGHDPENEAQVLNNLGSAYYFPGSYSEAQQYYDQAMNLVDQNAATKWSDYWRQITSFNQATLFQRLGRYEKALQIYRQVEESSKNLTPSDHAHLYANLGALYRRLGDPYKALDTYKAAQRLYELEHDVGGELTVLKNIGIVYALDLEDLARAREIFNSAIVLAAKTKNRREEMQSHLYLGEIRFRSHELLGARAEFERSRTLAVELGTTEEQWKSFYGLGKIEETSGNSGAAEGNYRQAIEIIEKTRMQLQLSALRLEFFADKREAYDALISLLLQKGDAAAAFSVLEKSRARNFQDRLDAHSREPRPSPLVLQQARAALAPETALMEYWTSGDRIGLVWCTQQADGMMLKRLSAEDMARVRKALDATSNGLSGNWTDQLEVFRTLLPDNLRFLDGIRHVIIVPDGWISYVPFDLLNAGQGFQSLLIEQYDITYLPTAALLRRPHSPQPKLWFPWTYELAAFGDPMVSSGKEQGAGDLQQAGAQRLPFSAQEIRSIAQLVHGGSELFLQQRDLKRLFLSSSVNNALLLHVSTHAFADGESPENSRLLFSPATSIGVPDYVFLRELYELNLERVRLATISACETERGKMIRGEGVQAFSRALLSAGAASSLTTLWRVDDELTAEFMKHFYYQALSEHKPKAEALRLAKLECLRSHSRLSDPSLWAAFVLNGDGATPLPSILSWPELLLVVAGFSAAVLLAVVRILRSRSRIHGEQSARGIVT